MRGMSLEGDRVPVEEQGPAQERDPAGEFRHAVDLVGRQDDRDPEVPVQLNKDEVDSPRRLDVHAARGLIEDQELGLADQRLRDEDSLGLAAGQPADPPAPEVVDVQQRQDLLRLLAFATRHTPERAGPGRPAEEDRLQDRGREIRVSGLGPLGNISETPEAFGTDRATEEPDGTSCWLLQAQDYREQRGLARAVRTEEPEEVVGEHPETDAVDGADTARVFDGDVPELQDRLSCIRHGSGPTRTW